MSDFDKEAERERLREKYEAEQEDREATQHMSELLLKGATMTNSHCGTCGDPIFRYDGQEFCPSCNVDGQETTGDADAQATAGADQPTQATTGASETPDAATTQSDSTAQNVANASATTPSANAAGTVDTNEAARDATDGVARGRQSSTGTDTPTVRPRDPVAVPDDAVGNVEATLQRYAAAASEADDPERARNCLAVVRDAAETLRALRADGR
jgi:uncharacterized Zn finger protein (UPF0148 family)